jgi:hypothetical protein
MTYADYIVGLFVFVVIVWLVDWFRCTFPDRKPDDLDGEDYGC